MSAVLVGLLVGAVALGILYLLMRYSVVVITSYSIHYTKLYDDVDYYVPVDVITQTENAHFAQLKQAGVQHVG